MIIMLKKIYNKFINNDVFIDLCFGGLFLLSWNEIGRSVRVIIAAFDGNMVKFIDANSLVKCEQSLYNLIRCNELSFYITIPIMILVALLYYKYKKITLWILIFIPIFRSYIVNMLI